MTQAESPQAASPWSALAYPKFRRVFFGGLSMGLGYTTLTTLAAWLMASLTPSAMMVALVQTAATLPSLLFGLLAGAMADSMDRKRILLATQLLLVADAVALGGMSLAGVAGPAVLLGGAFFVGTAFAIYSPAMQAVVHDLVPHRDLTSAMALTSTTLSSARIVGPALAATAAAYLGSAWALLGSTLFFLYTISSLRGWQSVPPGMPGLPERLFASIRSGLRYARHTPDMRSILVYNVSFSFCAAALLALMPVLARDQFGFGAMGFGMLLACSGIGAVSGAHAAPRLLRRGRVHSALAAGMLLSSIGIMLLAATGVAAVGMGATLLAGFGWGTVFACLSAGIQNTAPAWVRARAVSVGMVTGQASMAAGSAVWGAVATLSEPRLALAGAALLMLLLTVLNRRGRLLLKDAAHTGAAERLPELSVALEPGPDDGPVLIQIEYAIAPENEQDFMQLIRSMEPIRRRNGARDWNIFRDLESHGRFIERFVVHSWSEYMRLRLRTTASERALGEGVARNQRAGVPVKVSRLIAVLPD